MTFVECAVASLHIPFNSSTPKLHGKYSRQYKPWNDVGEYDELRFAGQRQQVQLQEFLVSGFVVANSKGSKGTDLHVTGTAHAWNLETF